LPKSSRYIFSTAIVAITLALATGCVHSGSSSSQQPVTVQIASAPQTIGAGANWQYSASVDGTTDQAVTWTVSGGGTIDSTGLTSLLLPYHLRRQ